MNLYPVFLGDAFDGLNDRVETTHRVEDALFHINVGHQVVHARCVVWGGAEEHCREIENLAKSLIFDVLCCEGI